MLRMGYIHNHTCHAEVHTPHKRFTNMLASLISSPAHCIAITKRSPAVNFRFQVGVDFRTDRSLMLAAILLPIRYGMENSAKPRPDPRRQAADDAPPPPFSLATPTQALSHEVGESVRLPGGITSVDHKFRVPLRWDQVGGGEGGGNGGGGQAPSDVEVFARWVGSVSLDCGE